MKLRFAEPARQWLALVALGIVWGTTWVAAGTLGESVPPLHAAAARFLLAALVLLPVVLGKRLRPPRGRPLAFVLLLSVTMVVLPFVLLLWAQPRLPSATVTVLFAAMPLLVALLTPGGVPSRATQAAIVGLGAMVLTVGASYSATQTGGAALTLLAVASVGISALLARRELRSVHPVLVTALLLSGAALLFLLAGLAFERGKPVQWSRDAIASLIFLGVVAGAPAYVLYFWLLQRLEAYKVVTLQWIEPLVALFETAFFLRLGLSSTMIAGSVVTVTSLILVMRARSEDDDSVSLFRN